MSEESIRNYLSELVECPECKGPRIDSHSLATKTLMYNHKDSCSKRSKLFDIFKQVQNG